jgi:hypothetical protein
MAEKKFFVDINLQGSALTNAKIGTNSGIGSTEGAFGYDASAHRLQYFDGTATKEVANLSDIAAVTGGLIFQGGYDPTTDTPDITDGTAYKGFFWAATAAGTFLGESVQVGDSIVAKVDNAGANVADWLILQGNIVIATDSVDGISRLATQTEANDGTEAGAVVITPATLQGKIDAQITPEISNKLPLAGGTMTGGINMAGNELNIGVGGSLIVATGATEIYFGDQRVNGIGTPASDDDAANKGYVDDQDALKLSLTGGTMSGGIDMGGFNIEEADVIEANRVIVLAPTNDGDAANKLYVDNAAATKLSIDGSNSMAANLNLSGNSLVNVDSISGNAGPLNINTASLLNGLDAQNTNITNLAFPTNSGDATNKTYVDDAASTAEQNAKDYADSLAPNYDAAGSADQALTDANAYTDTAVGALSFTQEIATSAWTLSGSHYEFYFVHNLGSDSLSVTTKYDGRVADFAIEYSPTDATIISNFIPQAPVKVSLIKADGNI